MVPVSRLTLGDACIAHAVQGASERHQANAPWVWGWVAGKAPEGLPSDEGIVVGIPSSGLSPSDILEAAVPMGHPLGGRDSRLPWKGAAPLLTLPRLLVGLGDAASPAKGGEVQPVLQVHSEIGDTLLHGDCGGVRVLSSQRHGRRVRGRAEGPARGTSES